MAQSTIAWVVVAAFGVVAFLLLFRSIKQQRIKQNRLKNRWRRYGRRFHDLWRRFKEHKSRLGNDENPVFQALDRASHLLAGPPSQEAVEEVMKKLSCAARVLLNLDKP